MVQIIKSNWWWGSWWGGSGEWDMKKSVYDPNNVGKNVYDYDNFIHTPEIPTKTSDLTNDSNFVDSSTLSTALSSKQNTLTAGSGIEITNDVISATWGWGEWNTKTFYLSGTSDLTNAQAAYDWYNAGKNPIIVDQTYWTCICAWNLGNSNYLFFVPSWALAWTSWNRYTTVYALLIRFTIANWNVTAITQTSFGIAWMDYLEPWVDYTTPYTPEYDGSPATKKYVDDSVSVVSGDSGVTYTIKVSNSDPTSWTASNIITLVP